MQGKRKTLHFEGLGSQFTIPWREGDMSWSVLNHY